jgi:cell division protein FtsL
MKEQNVLFSKVKLVEHLLYVLLILIIVLGIFILNMNGKINDLDRQLNASHSSIHTNTNYINSLRAQISTLMEKINTLEEESKPYSNFHYDVTGLSEEQTNLDIDITFSLKEIKPNDNLYLIITNKEISTDFQKVTFETTENLSFTIPVSLNYSSDYVVELMRENSEEVIKESMGSIDLKSKYNDRILFKGAESYTKLNDDEAKFVVHIFNNHYGVDEFKVKKVTLIEHYHTSVTTSDITNDIDINTNDIGQQIDYYSTHRLKHSFKIEVIVEDYVGNTYSSGELILYEVR